MKCGELRRERRAPAMTLIEGDGDAGIGHPRICLPSRADAVDTEMVTEGRHVALRIHRHGADERPVDIKNHQCLRMSGEVLAEELVTNDTLDIGATAIQRRA